jgi:hypothetical protein
MERNLPIGLAPDIHVSLVMLPEECRWLSDNPRRWWRREAKMKAMARLYRWKFARDLRRHERRFGAAHA